VLSQRGDCPVAGTQLVIGSIGRSVSGRGDRGGNTGVVMDKEFVEFNVYRVAIRVFAGPNLCGRHKLAVLRNQVSEEQRPDVFGAGQRQHGRLGSLQFMRGIDHLTMLVQPLMKSPLRASRPPAGTSMRARDLAQSTLFGLQVRNEVVDQERLETIAHFVGVVVVKVCLTQAADVVRQTFGQPGVITDNLLT